MLRLPTVLQPVFPNPRNFVDPLEYCCLEMVNVKEREERKRSDRRVSEHNVGEQYKFEPYKCPFTQEMVLPRLENGNCKILISITLYSEDFQEMKGTMRGVMKDAQNMFAKQICKPQELLVLVIADGLDRIKVDGLLRKMQQCNLYREEEFRNRLWKRDYIKKSMRCEDGCERYLTNKHLFEGMGNHEERRQHKQKRHNNVLHCFCHGNMQDFGFSQNDKEYIMKGHPIDSKIIGINYVFAIKHINGGKLNSHLFLFRGFCQYLKPKFTVLIDAGTEPRNLAITKLIQHMRVNPNVGGVCGSIEIDITQTQYDSCSEGLVVYSQYYEYKLSNYLDKAAESLFGFISVLPGAFSAYKMEAIQGRPLQEYLKGLEDQQKESPFQANMYLAEDRIMSMEIITKLGMRNTMAYLPEAIAMTDPQTELSGLLRQRRRWINGSNFAQFYVLKHFCNFCRTRHRCCCKVWISIFYIYYLINSIFAFMVVGLMYFTFSLVIRDFFSTQGHDPFEDDPTTVQHGNTTSVIVFEVSYLVLLFQTMILSLSVNLKSAKCQLNCISMYFGFLMTFFVVLAYLYFFVNLTSSSGDEPTNTSKFLVAFSVIIVIVSQVVPMLLHCPINCVRLIIGFFCYLFMVPTYVNMLTIYAYCNIHDISWGTKGLVGGSQGSGDLQARFKKFRYNMLLIWSCCNIIFGYALNNIARRGSVGVVLSVLSFFLAFSLVFRLVASLCFTCLSCCNNNCSKKNRNFRPDTEENQPLEMSQIEPRLQQ